MEHQYDKDKRMSPPEPKPEKNSITGPFIALGLVLSPLFISYISSFMGRFSSIILMMAALMPIAGVVTGVISLHQGRGRMSMAGKVMAMIAVALPLAVIAFILLFFIGAATGIVSLM